jgi:hypothetical protein
MKNQEAKVAAYSLLISVAIALLGACAGYLIRPTWQNTLAWFLAAFVGQFLLAVVTNKWIEFKLQTKAVELNLQAEAIVDAQSVPLSCSYCGVQSPVPVFVNRENTFDCPNCKQTNKAILQFLVVRTTQPIVNTYAAPSEGDDKKNE